MPTMTNPDTGASFDCPDNQVDTWRSAGWVLESEAGKKSRSTPPASTHTDAPGAGDDTEE